MSRLRDLRPLATVELYKMRCAQRVDAAWVCNIFHTAAGISDTMSLSLIWPARTGQAVGHAPGCTDNLPSRRFQVVHAVEARVSRLYCVTARG